MAALAEIDGITGGEVELHLVASLTTMPSDTTFISNTPALGAFKISRAFAEYHVQGASEAQRWEKKAPGRAKVEDFTFDLVAGEGLAMNAALQQAFTDRTTRVFALLAKANDNEGEGIRFNAYVVDIELTHDMDAVYMKKITLKIPGPPDYFELPDAAPPGG